MSILARAHYARKMGVKYEKFNVKSEKFNVFLKLKYEKFNENGEKRVCFSYLIIIFATSF